MWLGIIQAMTLCTDKDQTIADLEAQLAVQSALLKSKDDELNSVVKSKDQVIDQLKEALILERHRRFAKLNEALRSLQGELFNEAEQVSLEEATSNNDELDTVTVPAHERKRGGRKPLPADLPRIDVVHDLDEADKVCSKGHALELVGEKTSEQLDVVPMQIHVLRHIRKQYACPCCDKAGAPEIKTAAKPKQPIEKSQASPGLLAYITVGKYADSLPLYRQTQIFKRCDVELNRTTLASWMVRCGELVQPIINRLEEQLLNAEILHMDETPVQVLNEKGKPAHSKSYMWVRSGAPPNGGPIKLFDYDPSRSGAVPNRLLAGYAGALMVDGYEAYESVCQSQDLTRLGCWAHARRKFVEAAKGNKKNNGQANKVIKLIAKLYAIEKSLSDADTQTRHEQRQERAAPVIEQLRAWINDTQPKVPPQSLLGKATHYLNKQWPRLIAYLQDGQYPIDNNAVENAIRPFAVGRKNWLFSTSVDGAKASANLYSLIETAKANGLEPYGYLKRVFTELPNATSFNDVDALLPTASN